MWLAPITPHTDWCFWRIFWCFWWIVWRIWCTLWRFWRSFHGTSAASSLALKTAIDFSKKWPWTYSLRAIYRSASSTQMVAQMVLAQAEEGPAARSLPAPFRPPNTDSRHWPSLLCSNGPGALIPRQGLHHWRACKLRTYASDHTSSQNVQSLPYGKPFWTPSGCAWQASRETR